MVSYSALQLAAAARGRGSLGAGFSENYHVSLLLTLGHCCIDVLHFTRL